MNLRKFILAVGLSVTLQVMTVNAATSSLPYTDQELSNNIQKLKNRMPLAVPGEVTVQVEKDSDKAKSLSLLPPFSLTQLPSGRLLESGAFFKRDVILQNSSLTPAGITQDDFNDALSELRRAEIDSLRSKAKKAPADLYALSKAQVKPNTYPISLALLNYETVDQSVVKDASSFEKYIMKRSDKKLGESKVFSAATLQTDVVYGQSAEFVVPRDMIFLDEQTKIQSLTFEINGHKQQIKTDHPFKVNLSQQLRQNQQVNDTRSEQSFKLYINSNRGTYVAKGLFMWSTPVAAAQARMGRRNLSCFDLPPITASQLYANARGKINVRVYPSRGTVTNLGANNMGCNNGRSPRLKQVLVVVDGFDPGDNRTQENILEDFGPAITGFVSAGFDVVAVDYGNGRDFIQKNGLAVRELLVNHIPNWKTSDADRRVVVVAGSMGTQTSRYAMRTAELAGERHDVALWFSIDGPFQGANIPISLQAFVEFFSFSPSVKENLDGLNSIAASQQLLRNRYFDQNTPPSLITPSNTWYLPRREFYSYYGEMAILGLPQQSRNIGISSGSGNGRLQGETATEALGKVKFLELNYETALDVVIIRTLAQSDHLGEVFYGRYKVPGYLCKWPFNESDFCANWTMRLNLTNGQSLDTTAGGFRTSPSDVAQQWNTSPSSKGTMVSHFKTHNFIPTASSLNIPTNNVFYQPHSDRNAVATSGFDRIWYEGCNAQHVEQTSGMWALIQQELAYFLSGSTPTTTRPPFTIPNCDDNHPNVNYQILSASTVSEGDDMEIVVRRSTPARSYETVRVMVVGGTATAGADYTAAIAGQYSSYFPNNSNVARIRIPTAVDSVNEGTESIIVRLQGSSYADAGFPATFSTATRYGYIRNVNNAPITASCRFQYVASHNGPSGRYYHYKAIGNARGGLPVVEVRHDYGGGPFSRWYASDGVDEMLGDFYPGLFGPLSGYTVKVEFKDSGGRVAPTRCSLP